MRILFGFASSLVLFSCSAAFGVQELVLELPESPPAWSSLADLSYLVSWKAEGGLSSFAMAAPGSKLAVRVDRGLHQAILAEPRSRGRSLRPAGALYPGDIVGERPWAGFESLSGPTVLALDWPGGYAASVFLALAEAGLFPQAYDLGRIEAEVALRAIAELWDPWELGASEAARRLVAGSFRADSLRSVSRHRILLPLPGPWIPESPFAPLPTLAKGSWETEAGAEASLFLNPETEEALAVGACLEASAGGDSPALTEDCAWVRLEPPSASRP